MITISLNIPPKDLGLFIGKSGMNFKKMIAEMKKKILGKETEITPDEWSSVEILLKFVKGINDIKAIINCKSEYLNNITEILNKYVNIHNKKYSKYKRNLIKDNILVYKIGTEGKYIEKLIELLKCNIPKLKIDISKIPLVYSVSNISIEKQNKYYIGNYIYLGEIDCTEHIMIFITLNGTPEIKYMNSVINNFINTYLTITKKNENFEAINKYNLDIFNNFILHQNTIVRNKNYDLYSKERCNSPIHRSISC